MIRSVHSVIKNGDMLPLLRYVLRRTLPDLQNGTPAFKNACHVDKFQGGLTANVKLHFFLILGPQESAS